jgi:PmbA protein
MATKYDKYFTLAKKRKVDALELYISKNYHINFGLFHGEVSSYSLSDSSLLSARGIFNGKIGYASSEKIDKATPEFIVNQVIENAISVDKDDPAILFSGSEKYRRKKVYNPDIANLSIDSKMANLFEIENKLKNADKRVVEVASCDYSEVSNEFILVNSYGLKLKSKQNYYYYYASVVVKDGTDTKTGYKVHLSNDSKDFNIDKFVRQVIEDATNKIGGQPCKSGKYPLILTPKVTASLLEEFLSGASAEQIQKNSSLLAGKLNTLVASKKLTVLEAPLTKNCFFRYFDDEGVATYDKTIIKKGVLTTYFYNLLTAHKDNVTTTGNGYRGGGGKIGIDFVNLVIKPGRKSQKELIASLPKGLVINEVQGLHSGLNAQSGNFSLQASGFLVENGKITRPVNLITIAGNLLDIFKDVKEVANDSELQLSSSNVPSLLIKKVAVSGD